MSKEVKNYGRSVKVGTEGHRNGGRNGGTGTCFR